MSIFVCSHCGCLENSSLGWYHSRWMLSNDMASKDPHVKEVALSYKKILGLAESAELGVYCSACSPVWFNEKGEMGTGPRPANAISLRGSNKKYDGRWHGVFARCYYPKNKIGINERYELVWKPTGKVNGHREFELMSECRDCPNGKFYAAPCHFADCDLRTAKVFGTDIAVVMVQPTPLTEVLTEEKKRRKEKEGTRS